MRPDEAPPVAFDPVPRGARQRAEPERSTADYARDIWARVARSDAAVAAHPYGVRKRIRHAAGAGRATVSGRLIGRNADCLVVPYRTLDGELVGVEVINEAGAKQTFGSKGVLVLGNDREPALTQFVVEGWASAARLVFAMNRGNACAYVAGSKGRLERVARQVAERFPARQVVICAEVDHA
ncbi:MAG: hypothetical protein IPF57_11795 [Gammaproteobacteria bacterium]|nr:hypothetical protein [Gammaproteobacteria bacterium]